MTQFKPSDFKGIFPMESVWVKWEAERVAMNIMIILSRTSDTFRPLSWKEYEKHRMTDSYDEVTGTYPDFDSEKERYYFDGVIHFFESADLARTFCPIWDKIYIEEA